MKSLIETWMRCYMVTLKNKKAYKVRLHELLTWDNPPYKSQEEREAKIAALKYLIES